MQLPVSGADLRVWANEDVLCLFTLTDFMSFLICASLVAQMVENPLAMWETWVQSLGWKDPLEKRMATHSGILACRISWTIPRGRKELHKTERLSL